MQSKAEKYKKRRFDGLPQGTIFEYDGQQFVKFGESGWQLQGNNTFIKEWGFSDSMVNVEPLRSVVTVTSADFKPGRAYDKEFQATVSRMCDVLGLKLVERGCESSQPWAVISTGYSPSFGAEYLFYL